MGKIAFWLMILLMAVIGVTDHARRQTVRNLRTPWSLNSVQGMDMMQ